MMICACQAFWTRSGGSPQWAAVDATSTDSACLCLTTLKRQWRSILLSSNAVLFVTRHLLGEKSWTIAIAESESWREERGVYLGKLPARLYFQSNGWTSNWFWKSRWGNNSPKLYLPKRDLCYWLHKPDLIIYKKGQWQLPQSITLQPSQLCLLLPAEAIY